jgi:hypothetical protein
VAEGPGSVHFFCPSVLPTSETFLQLQLIVTVTRDARKIVNTTDQPARAGALMQKKLYWSGVELSDRKIPITVTLRQ